MSTIAYPIQVYRMDTYPGENFSHRVDREESWALKLDQSFVTLDEAKEYVRTKSRIHTDLPLFLVDLPEGQKESAVDEFCFTDKYLYYQRFFIGKPDTKKIKAVIEQQGANFRRN